MSLCDLGPLRDACLATAGLYAPWYGKVRLYRTSGARTRARHRRAPRLEGAAVFGVDGRVQRFCYQYNILILFVLAVSLFTYGRRRRTEYSTMEHTTWRILRRSYKIT